MIKYIHEGGAKTLATKPSIALTYWLCHSRQEFPLPNTPKALYVFRDPRPIPQGERLIEVSKEACDKHFNKAPELDPNKEYEDRCWDFMQWLAEHGDVVALERTNE